jgi:hypothetical protein
MKEPQSKGIVIILEILNRAGDLFTQGKRHAVTAHPEADFTIKQKAQKRLALSRFSFLIRNHLNTIHSLLTSQNQRAQNDMWRRSQQHKPVQAPRKE